MPKQAFENSLFDLEKKWLSFLKEELEKDYMLELSDFLEKERLSGKEIYPAEEKIFQAFHATAFDKLSVVLLGQDPYHGPNQANGLSFSVRNGLAFPPSLRNIFLELQADLNYPFPKTSSLLPWAQQGVLLLNASLSVERKKPMSHSGKGWETFTDFVIRKIANERENLVFILWGKFAQEKCLFLEEISNKMGHLLIKSAHPSPFSAHRGFFSSRPFSRTNAFLYKKEKTLIDWYLD